MAIFAICAAFGLSLLLSAIGIRSAYSFFYGCAVVPIFVIVAEFAIPDQGGGASIWPVALIVGGIYGAASSGAGILTGRFFQKCRNPR